MLRLTGKCNQCGLCCMIGDLKCAHLEIVNTPGTPMATRCRIYYRRPYGQSMIIPMVNPEGVVTLLCECAPDKSEAETQAVIERGIGKGCSLEVKL